MPYNITNRSCTFESVYVSAKAPLYSNTSANYRIYSRNLRPRVFCVP
jgi:hypothetical protein